jgi:hypothetical protein
MSWNKSRNPLEPAYNSSKQFWHLKQVRQPSMQIPSKPMHFNANAIKINILKANALRANALQRHAIKENIHNYQS